MVSPIAKTQQTDPARFLFVGCALVAIALAYLPALSGPFVWDDHLLIEHEASVHDLAQAHRFFATMFFSDEVRKGGGRGFYRPLVMVSYALDWARSDGAPSAFHFTNLVAHLLVCALVYALARRLGVPERPAAAATAIFGVLPRLAESVAWISGRTDVFATLFVLIALIAWTSQRRGARWVASAALLLGLLSKEVAVAGVFGVVVYEWAQTAGGRMDRARAALKRAFPAFVALGVYAIFRIAATQGSSLPVPLPLPAWRRALLPLEALGSYISMLLDPLRPRLQVGIFGVFSYLGIVAGSAAVISAVAFAKPVWRRLQATGPLTKSLAGVAGVAVAMVLHVVRLPLNVVAADRFLYLPLAAGTVLLVASVRWRRHTALWSAIAGLAFLLCWTRTYDRAREWAHELTLWQRGVDQSGPLNSFVVSGLADLMIEHGRPKDALPLYEEAGRRDRLYFDVVGVPHGMVNASRGINIAVARSRMGEHAQAETILRDLLVTFPDDLKIHLNLALVVARQLRFDEAEAMLTRVSKTWHDSPIPLRVLEMFQSNRTARSKLVHGTGSLLETAILDDELGRVAEAREGYWRLLGDSGSTQEARRRAAGYLAVNAPLDDAKRATALLASVHPEDPYLSLLDATIVRRSEEEAPLAGIFMDPFW